jgi:hypothetical protein
MTNHPAEHGIKFDVVAASAFTRMRKFKPFPPALAGEKGFEHNPSAESSNGYFSRNPGPLACQTTAGALFSTDVVA